MLSVDAYAEEDGDGVLDTIVVVCDAACQDQGGGGSGGGTHGSGDTPVGGEGDGSQTGGGGLGVVIPPGTKFALNTLNHQDGSNCSSSDQIKVNHATIDYNYTIETLGPNSIENNSLFVTTYENGDREIYRSMSFGIEPIRLPEFGCGVQ